MSAQPGRVITFYSFKGGTGRTMSLANVAYLLAQQTSTDKRGVLMIDWDLEAPSLHRFFRDQLSRITSEVFDPDDAIDRQPGLLDFFLQLRSATSSYSSKQPQQQDEARALVNELRPERFVVETDIAGLSLLKAGRLDDEYSKNINNFRWEEFHNKAPWLIRSFCEHLAKLYRYVIIDSRTGLTDVGGICTMLLPEILVFVFTPNRQSIQPGLQLIKRATDYRRNSTDFRPLVVFPLVSRVDPARDTLRQDWRMGNRQKGIAGYQPQFEKLFEDVYQLPSCSLEDYFTEIQIQHNPDYAYGEVVAALVEQAEDRLSLSRSYRTFVARLTESPSPWQKEPTPLAIGDQSNGQRIVFLNGNVARSMIIQPDISVKEVIRTLHLNQPEVLIVIVGDVDTTVLADERLHSLLSDSLARIAGDLGASVIDAGISEGASKLIGEGIASRGRLQDVIGVAPQGRVTYPGLEETSDSTAQRVELEPNHNHFVMVQGKEWGDELEAKYQLASELGKDASVVSILLRGDFSTKKELLRSVKQGWPILVVEGTGGLADEIALVHRSPDGHRSSRSQSRDVTRKVQGSYTIDPLLSEILSEGNVRVFRDTSSHLEFERMVYRTLQSGRALELAWQRFAIYDREAKSKLRLSQILQISFLLLACAGVIAALGPDIVSNLGWKIPSALPSLWLPTFFLGGMILAFQLHDTRRPDKLAENLRSVAEGIKSEIFKYRSGVEKYGVRRTADSTAESAMLEEIAWWESTTDLAKDSQPVPVSPEQPASTIFDDGYSILSPEKYLSVRLHDQRRFYLQKGRRASSKVLISRVIMLLTLMLGLASTTWLMMEYGSTTVIASIAPLIVAITITLVVTMLGAIEISKLDQTRQIAGIVTRNLGFVEEWWSALSRDEKAEPKNFEKLVNDTENVIKTAWQSATDEIRSLEIRAESR